MRLHFIDIAKGIGIILVVMFHIPNIDDITTIHGVYWGGYINIFYMPLFFLLSGLFFNPTKIKKRLLQLLFPYVGFMLIATVLFVCKGMLLDGGVDWQQVYAPIIGRTYGYPNTPCWFLLSLMQIVLIACLEQRWFRGLGLLAVSLAVSIIGYLWGCLDKDVRYYVDVSLLCNVFYVIGYVFKDQIIKKLSVKLAFTCLVISLIAYFIKPYQCNVSQNYIPNGYVSFLLISAFASFGIIGSSRLLTKTKLGGLLEYFGRNSLVILCTHSILISVLLKLLNELAIGSTLEVLIGTCLIMIMEVPIIFIVNKYFPLLIGKTKAK